MVQMRYWSAPLAGAFLIAGCSTPPTDEAKMGAAASLGKPDDAQMIAGCWGENQGGTLSYSKKTDTLILSTVKNDTITVSPVANREGEQDRQFARLNDHCFGPK